MKPILKRLTFIALLFCVSTINAQTVNNGIMVIEPDTVVSTYFDFSNNRNGEFRNDGDFYVFKNFNNDGIVTFTPAGNGYTRFVGVDNQRITGTLPAELNDVLFENSSVQPAFHLEGDISIAGNSEFKKGIVNNDDFGGNIAYEQDATHSETSNDSHVDGHVIKNGNKAFIYPIGDKNVYRFAGISAPADVASTFRGKYFFDNSAPLYDHTKKPSNIEIINNQEYWTLENTGNKGDIMLTLSWDETTTTPANIVADPKVDKIVIVRWDEATQMWVNEGGIVDVANRTVTTAINVTGYGVFTLARVESKEQPLPCGKEFKIYNAISPGSDTVNAEFKVVGLAECSSDNTVEIYNRWGVKVFETHNYGANGNVFNGYSSGRVTINKGQLLPPGTYFYILNVNYKNEKNENQTYKDAGYLYLSN
ncbi:gliding motility-associated C-terminal domain-containing protein [Flavobacterium sp. GA093]|uniref:Gliding motility-associated C-terminal domain-containing protein n=1 Tax=Flavobacterium hydrocarbonoxydans TaxID=2683249 RepID=A0A6I4NRE7_9FLAO|nr:gliding motility-associated C-terminal domain-containing protein [Flavobacterium hydrocarbonoxydans]MWB96783.1 gliding motility-associated C-terminal domain-containing protein [Flavobacterium hydrocarbonoxydans]